MPSMSKMEASHILRDIRRSWSPFQQFAYSCVSDSKHVLHNSHNDGHIPSHTILRLEPHILMDILIWQFYDNFID